MNPFPRSAYILVLIVPDQDGNPQIKSAGIFSEPCPTVLLPGEWLIHSEFKAENYHEAYKLALQYLSQCKPTDWIRRFLSERVSVNIPN